MTQPPALRDRPDQWPVVSSRDIHRDDWVVALREDTLHRPGHPEETFGRLVLEHPGAVMVLALDEDDRVCCLRQYRHAAGGWFIELPAGIRDSAGEDPVDTARRELLEEAEFEADHWDLLLESLPTAGITNERHLLYLARGLRPADRGEFEMRHEEAELEVFWVPFADLLDAVLDGRVQEGPLVIAVLALDAGRRRGRWTTTPSA